MLYTDTVSKAALSLLKELQQNTEFKDCILAGGTALALQLGHRISVDLDFFSDKDVSFDNIKALFRGYDESFELSSSTNILVWSINNVKVDIVKYSYPMLSPPVNEQGMKLYSIKDIAAMKLEAIKGRGRKRDFYDLYHLLKIFDLKEMLELNASKFSGSNSFLILKSLTFFDDADIEPDIVVPMGVTPVNWEEIKEAIIVATREF